MRAFGRTALHALFVLVTRTCARWAAPLILALVHVALTMYFVDVRALLAGEALQGEDYDLHAGQVFRFLEAVERFGEPWSYDVSLVAGQPEGTILDAGTKGWEVWTYVLHRLGLDEGTAFNSFVLVVMLAAPAVVWCAGYLFELSAGARLLAAALTTLLWFFDSFFHWVWWVGMVAYACSAFCGLLVLGLFHRFTSTRASTRWLLATGIALTMVLLIHPYAFFVLAPSMLGMYLRATRSWTHRVHAALGVMVACVLASHAWWLLPAYAHFDYVLDSAYYAQGGARYLFFDFVNLLRSGDDTGVIGTRTAVRIACLGLAIVQLRAWHRAGDRRALPLGLALGAGTGLAYLGVYLPGLSHTQPYRHVLAAGLTATLPAGALLSTAWAHRRALTAAPACLGGAVVVALLLAQHLAGEIAYFLPRVLPTPHAAYDGAKSPLSPYGFLTVDAGPSGHVHYGLPHESSIGAAGAELVSWVGANIPRGARILIEPGPLGERIARTTEIEVIGGFRERNLLHARASFFRRFGERTASQEELALYLRELGIGWVIAGTPRREFEEARGLLEPLRAVGGYSIYRVAFPVSPILRGGGTLEASTNQITITASAPEEDLVLAYHFHELLRCAPACQVLREPSRFDEVGFIRIPAPHEPSLRIFNGYGARDEGRPDARVGAAPTSRTRDPGPNHR